MPVFLIAPKDDMATFDDAVLFADYSAMEQYVLRFAQERHHNGYDAEWCYVLMYDGIHQLEKVFIFWPSKDGHILHRAKV